MKIKVCQCFNNWGKESPDCEIGFTPSNPNEQYCDACKPIAVKARVAFNVMRYRQRKEQSGHLLDITRPDWTACWIDRVCTCCGTKGVPTFNRFLCIRCWSGHGDGDYTINLDLDIHEDMWYNEKPSEIKHITGEQDELWHMILDNRRGWKDNLDPLKQVSVRLRELFGRMGYRMED